MRTKRLGAHGPEISVVGYGAWEAGGDVWGSPAEQEDIVAAMHAAIDAGMNWIDTAEAYGDGRSEELVGKVLRDRRGEAMVLTKVAPFASGAKAEDVRRAIVGSLARLDVDVIDLYQVHWPSHDVPVEETWGGMAELVDEGLARFIGVSNFDRELVERCVRSATSIPSRTTIRCYMPTTGRASFRGSQSAGSAISPTGRSPSGCWAGASRGTRPSMTTIGGAADDGGLNTTTSCSLPVDSNTTSIESSDSGPSPTDSAFPSRRSRSRR